MDEFAQQPLAGPNFLLNPMTLTRTSTPRWHLAHVRAELASQSPANASFSRFEELPIEIRLKIWKYALPGRRRIAINKTKIRDREALKSYYELYPYEPSPAILFVCHDSREVALKYYHRLLESVQGGQSGGVVYMNFEIDVLYLDGVSMTWALNFPGVHYDLERVKHIALRGETALFPQPVLDIYAVPHFTTWLLQPFTSLHSLFVDDQARHSLPRIDEILAGVPIDRHTHTIPSVSGIFGHQQWRFHQIWLAIEKMNSHKASGEKVVQRPWVACRMSWEGIKNFDEEEYHELRVAQFNMEKQIEDEWVEKEEMEKLAALPGWGEHFTPLSQR